MLTMYTELFKMKLRTLVKSEKGQGLVEYALILGLISIVAIGLMTTTGTQIMAKFTAVVSALGGKTS